TLGRVRVGHRDLQLEATVGRAGKESVIAPWDAGLGHELLGATRVVGIAHDVPLDVRVILDLRQEKGVGGRPTAGGEGIRERLAVRRVCHPCTHSDVEGRAWVRVLRPELEVGRAYGARASEDRPEPALAPLAIE